MLRWRSLLNGGENRHQNTKTRLAPTNIVTSLLNWSALQVCSTVDNHLCSLLIVVVECLGLWVCVLPTRGGFQGHLSGDGFSIV